MKSAYRFLHDLYGYRSKHQVAHATLRVIEQHVLDHPDQWESKTFTLNFHNDSSHSCEGLWNRAKGIFIAADNWYNHPTVRIWDNDDRNFNQAYKVPEFWYLRLNLLAGYHANYRAGISNGINAKEQLKASKEIVAKFDKLAKEVNVCNCGLHCVCNYKYFK